MRSRWRVGLSRSLCGVVRALRFSFPNTAISLAALISLTCLPGCVWVGIALSLVDFGDGSSGTVASNALPAAVGLEVDERLLSDEVAIQVTLIDADQDPLTLTLWTVAAGDTLPMTLVGPPETYPSSPNGVPVDLLWNVGADFPDYQSVSRDVTLIARPQDAHLDPGTPDEVSVVVGNDPITGSFLAPLHNQSVSGNITVQFELSDPRSDVAQVAFEFLRPGSNTWEPATIVVGNTNGLETSPIGLEHSVAWDSLADLGTTVVLGLQLRATPTDTGPGQDFTSALFEVSNNLPPNFMLEPHDSRWPDEVNLIGRLSNPETTESLHVTVNWSDDGFATSNPATMRVGGALFPSPGLSHGLVASATGLVHSFDWLARTDLGPGSQNAVSLRFTVFDQIYTQPPVTSNVLIVGNDPPTVRFGVQAPGTKGFDVTLRIEIEDSTVDDVDVSLTYKVVGSSAVPATINGGTLGLASAPGQGALHSLVWDSASDLGDLFATVTLFAQGTDEFGAAGPIDSTTVFIENRSSSPIATIGGPVSNNTDTLTIMVTEVCSRSPLAGATIWVDDDTANTALTDATGRAFLTGLTLPVGADWAVTAGKPGYSLTTVLSQASRLNLALERSDVTGLTTQVSGVVDFPSGLSAFGQVLVLDNVAVPALGKTSDPGFTEADVNGNNGQVASFTVNVPLGRPFTLAAISEYSNSRRTLSTAATQTFGPLAGPVANLVLSMPVPDFGSTAITGLTDVPPISTPAELAAFGLADFACGTFVFDTGRGTINGGALHPISLVAPNDLDILPFLSTSLSVEFTQFLNINNPTAGFHYKQRFLPLDTNATDLGIVALSSQTTEWFVLSNNPRDHFEFLSSAGLSSNSHFKAVRFTRGVSNTRRRQWLFIVDGDTNQITAPLVPDHLADEGLVPLAQPAEEYMAQILSFLVTISDPDDFDFFDVFSAPHRNVVGQTRGYRP